MSDSRLQLVDEQYATPAQSLDMMLNCAQVQVMTHDVKTFVFSLPEGTHAPHVPGQYITLSAWINGKEVSRCYTLSSPPTRGRTLAITVKRTPDGEMSNWLHDNVETGSMLRVQGPAGEFSTDEHPAPHYLFVTAGSGITPALSMTRALFDNADGADVVFVNFARTPDDLIARRELEAMAAVSERIRLVLVCEGDSAHEVWHGFRGRITPELIAAAVPDAWARETFICGPQVFMDRAHEVLKGAGVIDHHRHDESFDLETLLPAAPHLVAEQDAATAHTVTFAKSGVEVQCPLGKTLLEAAGDAGLRLPNSCSQGVCGTCKQSVVSGEVDLQHGGGIRPREIAAGKTLLCCARPTSDVVIDA